MSPIQICGFLLLRFTHHKVSNAFATKKTFHLKKSPLSCTILRTNGEFMKNIFTLLTILILTSFSLSCSENEEVAQEPVKTTEQLKLEANVQKLTTLLETNNPFTNKKGEAPSITQNILANKEAFLYDLEKVLQADKAMADDEYDIASFLLRADKQVSLPEGYTPPNIVELTQETAENGNYMLNRLDLSLRAPVEKALSEMATSAANDGITLLVSSTYRSYDYQAIVFERNVQNYGLEMAERDSARPGRSQHQLGTVIDFGSITNDFASTKAGLWVHEHAPSFGWSLSFPPEYEIVTGYVWESWHWRYIGVDAVRFQEKWFNNIQQYMIEFVYAWNLVSNY